MTAFQFPAEGEVLADKYRVDRVLGQGGMGLVVAATHVHLDQRVAIKFLLPEATAHPEIVERFAREARAAARMQGKNVVRVLDVGTLPDNRTFMVMEYLEGFDLEKILETHGALPVTEAVGYVLEALEALAEAHAKGIVHRDLKPGNLFLSNQPDGSVVVKVLDFGISKLKDDRVALTKTSAAMGTAFYMSPEQLTNAKDVDERADVWSMGIILYELVSNLRPFDGESMPEIIAKILRNKRAPLVELGRGIPAEFDEIISRCLASDREGRYADVAELAEALLPFAPTGGATHVERIVRVRGRRSIPPHVTRLVSGAPPGSSASPGARQSTGTEPATPSAQAWERGAAATQLAVATGVGIPSNESAKTRKNTWLAIPAVAVLAIGGVGAWMWQGQANNTAGTTTSVASSAALLTPPLAPVSHELPAIPVASIAPAVSASTPVVSSAPRSSAKGDGHKKPPAVASGAAKNPPAENAGGGLNMGIK